ncbi:C-terminal binding protein [Parapedobacter sp. 2B3]|uniref:C-terminal binding protein n=1 Tax=Parapedobacter sp. 2B3 TaxID=3342381 RepID=UPI0035B5CA1B
MLFNVVITDSGFANHDPERELLKGHAELKKIDWKDEEELRFKTRDADVLLVQWASISQYVIEGLERCKAIIRYGIGVDNIDLKAAKEKGIRVCNVPDYCINEVADHTIALALAALRQIPAVDTNVRQGDWSIVLPKEVAPFDEMVYGLAGFGRIAQAVAKRALGLGFAVKAYDPFVAPESMRLLHVEPVDRDTLMQQSDILSLHLPLKPDTVHFLNGRSIARMKPNALVVNTSRGGLIDTAALTEAISKRQIWGAALDVFEEEPLPLSHKLMEMPEVVLSSHVAWYSRRSIPLLQRKVAEEALRAISGVPPLHSVIPFS